MEFSCREGDGGESGARRRELEFSWRERESAVRKSGTGERERVQLERVGQERVELEGDLEFSWRESAVGKCYRREWS